MLLLAGAQTRAVGAARPLADPRPVNKVNFSGLISFSLYHNSLIYAGAYLESLAGKYQSCKIVYKKTKIIVFNPNVLWHNINFFFLIKFD